MCMCPVPLLCFSAHTSCENESTLHIQRYTVAFNIEIADCRCDAYLFQFVGDCDSIESIVQIPHIFLNQIVSTSHWRVHCCCCWTMDHCWLSRTYMFTPCTFFSLHFDILMSTPSTYLCLAYRFTDLSIHFSNGFAVAVINSSSLPYRTCHFFTLYFSHAYNDFNRVIRIHQWNKIGSIWAWRCVCVHVY